MYFKVFNEEDNHKDFQYKDGLNVDSLPFNDNPNNSCVEGGLYFTDEKHICGFLNYGDYIREIEVPEGETIVPDDEKFRSHSLFLKPRKSLNDLNTWIWMNENNVDLTDRNNYAIQWTSKNGHLDVVKYLHENGADLTDLDNDAIRLASANGHLDVVKYLHENGADLTASNNRAIQLASRYGHLDVVKYLHENGADLTDDDNCAIQLALENGHLDVVKYLHENGADLTAYNNYAIQWASRNGHLDVVKYLHENGAYSTWIRFKLKIKKLLKKG